MSKAETHCWHASPSMLLTNPPAYLRVCCHCGTRILGRDVYRELTGHGPHAPAGSLRVVAGIEWEEPTAACTREVTR